MKQLLASGWMHNRLRMITASFLTKLLRQDWRKGACFFMNHLIDGDFASNLGGWQWSASVGADAAPYFRIFSPMRQAERFDPKGDYVAHWLPELKELKGMQRHDPAFAAKVGRPAPIIDYSKARAASLADYQRQ
jgi:deoxyribodipyrimidine photo-lyase